ncbi:MAG: twin-arginine translocation signal domain-containing protein, partial [Verrucomicrobia bacterium]|nr:twin-arginine translocation signal domain-containing protein [Verrucomicrobiota bacterium]
MSNISSSRPLSRRQFIGNTALGVSAAALAGAGSTSLAQQLGARPGPSPGVEVLNPKARVPVGLIIDDSTC